MILSMKRFSMPLRLVHRPIFRVYGASMLRMRKQNMMRGMVWKPLLILGETLTVHVFIVTDAHSASSTHTGGERERE